MNTDQVLQLQLFPSCFRLVKFGVSYLFWVFEVVFMFAHQLGWEWHSRVTLSFPQNFIHIAVPSSVIWYSSRKVWCQTDFSPLSLTCSFCLDAYPCKAGYFSVAIVHQRILFEYIVKFKQPNLVIPSFKKKIAFWIHYFLLHNCGVCVLGKPTFRMTFITLVFPPYVLLFPL